MPMVTSRRSGFARDLAFVAGLLSVLVAVLLLGAHLTRTGAVQASDPRPPALTYRELAELARRVEAVEDRVGGLARTGSGGPAPPEVPPAPVALPPGLDRLEGRLGRLEEELGDLRVRLAVGEVFPEAGSQDPPRAAPELPPPVPAAPAAALRSPGPPAPPRRASPATPVPPRPPRPPRARAAPAPAREAGTGALPPVAPSPAPGTTPSPATPAPPAPSPPPVPLVGLRPLEASVLVGNRLVMAARAGLSSLVASMLDAGASPQARDQEGVTPLEAARAAGRTEVAELLRARGATR